MLHKVNFPNEPAFPVEVSLVDGEEVFTEVDDIPTWHKLVELYEDASEAK